MDLVSPIDDWFTRHLDDGEVGRWPKPHPLLGSVCAGGTVFLTTKPSVGAALLEKLGHPPSMAIMGTPGLPGQDQVAWLSTELERSSVAFLGDLDPPDLLIFAFLKRSLGVELNYAGISDRMLIATKLHSRTSTFVISQSAAELSSQSLLREAIPSLRSMVGGHMR